MKKLRLYLILVTVFSSPSVQAVEPFQFQDDEKSCKWPANFYEYKMRFAALELFGEKPTEPAKPSKNIIRNFADGVANLFGYETCPGWVKDEEAKDKALAEDFEKLKDIENDHDKESIPKECFAAVATNQIPEKLDVKAPLCKNLPNKGFPLCYATDQNMEPKNDPNWCDHVPYTTDRPCLSTSWANLMRESLRQVTKCMAKAYGRDPKQTQKELFWMWSRESGMIPNARSGSNVFGVAQVSKDAIDELNPNETAIKNINANYNKNPTKQAKYDRDAQLNIENSKIQNWNALNKKITGEECKNVKNTLDRLAKGPVDHPPQGIGGDEWKRNSSAEGTLLKSNTCSRVAIPPNPLLSMIYGAEYYFSREKNADSVFDEIKKTIGTKSLNADVKSYVNYSYVNYHFYNGGDSQMSVIYKGAAKDCRTAKNIKKGESAWDCIKRNVDRRVDLTNNDKGRKAEIKAYPKAIQKLENKINNPKGTALMGKTFKCDF